MPKYVAPTIGAKWTVAASSGAPSSPYGRCPAILSAGTATSSSTTSCEAVPRMPSVSHVSSIRTPGADSGTLKCITSASTPGSPSTAHVATTVAPGDWLQNVLRPLIR